MRFLALKELTDRYRNVLAAAWAARNELKPVDRSDHERAFLPAALELQDSPPHPAARVALWMLMSFLLITLLWAFFGKIDVVAVAPGKLIVSDKSKVVQPLEPGVVKAIHVKDGQQVEAGQILIELDSTITGAENDKSRVAWIDASLEALRAQALLDALHKKRLPELQKKPELPSDDPAFRIAFADSQGMVLSQWQEIQAKLATIDSDTARKKAEQAGIREQVRKLEQTLPIVAQRTADYKNLYESKVLSKHDYLEKEQLRIEIEQDLSTQRKKFEELSEGLNTNQRQKEAAITEFKRTQHDNLTKALEKAHQLAQDVVRTKRQFTQTRITAPVSGMVQQLAVHTVGGVVTEAQPLMVIVPNEDSVEVEAMLDNKDIGFVKTGQDAAVKIETFLFTKYGFIDGKVQTVSLDAIQDEKRGLIYATRIRLSRSTIEVEGKMVKLTPGMAVTVEIKTAQRRVIDYFLSPLIQHVSESFRER